MPGSAPPASEGLDWHGCCVQFRMEDLILCRPSATQQTQPIAPVVKPIASCRAVAPAPVRAEPAWLAGALEGSLSAVVGLEAALVI